ncbi:MAG TPA: YaiI/YqxD family protein [bacterium]|nr:YaiI/YqxD family protein [bacterium]
MRIWIDADACPKMVKEFIFKAARRLGVPTTLVANKGLFLPQHPLIALVVVGGGVDEADHYIVDHCAENDLVVTADIPLASALVEKGVAVVSPRGTVYTPDNVKEALATRNLMQELRENGIMQGGPAPLGPNDKVQFANAFDREMTRLRRKRG